VCRPFILIMCIILPSLWRALGYLAFALQYCPQHLAVYPREARAHHGAYLLLVGLVLHVPSFLGRATSFWVIGSNIICPRGFCFAHGGDQPRKAQSLSSACSCAFCRSASSSLSLAARAKRSICSLGPGPSYSRDNVHGALPAWAFEMACSFSSEVPLPSNARGVKAGFGFDFDTGGAVLDGAAAPSVGLVAGARRGVVTKRSS
jgi:hypothetical protein